MQRLERAQLALFGIAACAVLATAAWIAAELFEGSVPSAPTLLDSMPQRTPAAEESNSAARAEVAATPSAVARQDPPEPQDIVVLVVDREGQPVPGIAVATLDHQKWNPHPLERLSECTYGHSSYGRAPALISQTALFSEDPLARMAAMKGSIEVQRKLAELLDKPAWHFDGKRHVLELEREFLSRATTNARGEAHLSWNRTQHPSVHVGFAFPSRIASSAILESRDAAEPARVRLELPALERVLASCTSGERQRWKARVSAASNLKDGSKLWIAWGEPLFVPDENAEQEWIWERGLEARLEAAFDAPLASVVVLPLPAVTNERRLVVLSSNEHYSTLRGTVVAADGSSLAGSVVGLSRTSRSDPNPRLATIHRGDLHEDRIELALDEYGSFSVWMPARPLVLRERQLCIRLQEAGADGDERVVKRPQVRYSAQSGKEEIIPAFREPALEDRETYVELGVEAAGTQRELGTLRLGDGPHLLGGLVRWEDGAVVEGGVVILPYGVTAVTQREALRIAGDGSFRRLGIAPRGTFKVEVAAAGMHGTTAFEVELGRRDVEFRVPRRVGLGGRVVLPAWDQIDVCVRTQQGHEHAARTQADGSFMVLGVPWGTCDVIFRSGGVDLHAVHGVVVAGEGSVHPEALRSVDLRLQVTHCVLEFRDERGKKRLKQKFALEDKSSGFKLEGSSGPDGRFPCTVPKSVEYLVVRVPTFRPCNVAVTAEISVLTLIPE